MRYAAAVMPALSTRLEAVLELLSPCRMLVDVGTDHGLIPISAVARGIAQRAIASDLRDAPLRSARPRIDSAGLGGRVMMLRANGLSALASDSVDAVVMAGMSGELMVRLCDAAPQVLEGASQLVLQPNSDALAVRTWALLRGWHLTDERMLIARGQFFAVCAFQRGRGPDPAYAVSDWSESALCMVGPALLARRDPAALRFCEWQCLRLGELVAGGVHTLLPELTVWRAARAFMSPTDG